METQTITNRPMMRNESGGFTANPRIFLTRDGKRLIHLLPGNMRFDFEVNAYMRLLGAETSVEAPSDEKDRLARGRAAGYQATSDVFLSADGQYLVHRAPGVVITKHVNLYKQILGIPYTPKARTNQSMMGAQVA